ncbi:helix-turn-helix transcriptional regulator [Curtobacterium sp. MCBA15_008]|uniref:ArsR/SmtB family transcription factor n=1 Tax=Curtobacterium sp. MCBA15_008 TaxID=1898736 RepID=UPI0008DCFE4D|nr:metalloregulator ArsR/SmtB family transcription factor [Curtobacterium sp. MCBA15_008]OII12574.1 transcriptional regulator [Curtobacterium sp. MCBA15_008]
MDAIWGALADGHRRTMLAALRDRPMTVNELADLVPIARPGVSRHLRVLRESGLVEAEPDAQRRVYRLRTEPLTEIDEWLRPYRDRWDQRLDALDTEVARGRNERKARG